MSIHSASIARHASRMGAGKQLKNLTFEQREEQRRLDAEADGRLFIPSRTPEQARAFAIQADSLHGSAHPT